MPKSSVHIKVKFDISEILQDNIIIAAAITTVVIISFLCDLL